MAVLKYKMMTHKCKPGIIVLVFALILGCSSTEMESLLDNPNAVTPENAELDMLYNNVMLDFAEFNFEVARMTMPYVRMLALSANNLYTNQHLPQDFDVLWEKAYSDLLPDINLVIELGEEGGFTIHSGSAKVLKSYILMVMVDIFGDIPYSQAFQGSAFLSPEADDDATVYGAAFALLESAITDLTFPIGIPENDIFYGGNASKWIRAANSMKLRYYINTRLVSPDVSGVNSLIGNLIESEPDDFHFEYGLNRKNPSSRNPWYYRNYEANGGTREYQSNYYMWQFFGEKDVEDPRIR
jgi:hypothetical protein